jgi:S-adenosylmethionine hydrolase
MSIISLLSDFGQRDPYVAEMKAVILAINPEAKIVDISHDIEKFNIRVGAFSLASATPYFPRNTVHVAVVDPGVGTKRRPIIIKTRRNLYVGPDNGLLMLAAIKETILKVYTIENSLFMLSKVSNTFHGRDIFSPIGAHLSKGEKPSNFGSEIEDYVFPEFANLSLINGELIGEVMYIDDFGNIISNISAEDNEQYGVHIGDFLVVTIGKKIFKLKFHVAYGNVAIKSPLALIGGSGFLEVAINLGDASDFFGANVGDAFCIRKIADD